MASFRPIFSPTNRPCYDMRARGGEPDYIDYDSPQCQSVPAGGVRRSSGRPSDTVDSSKRVRATAICWTTTTTSITTTITTKKTSTTTMTTPTNASSIPCVNRWPTTRTAETKTRSTTSFSTARRNCRGYNRQIDFTLHTILEESCEDSGSGTEEFRGQQLREHRAFGQAPLRTLGDGEVLLVRRRVRRRRSCQRLQFADVGRRRPQSHHRAQPDLCQDLAGRQPSGDAAANANHRGATGHQQRVQRKPQADEFDVSGAEIERLRVYRLNRRPPPERATHREQRQRTELERRRIQTRLGTRGRGRRFAGSPSFWAWRPRPSALQSQSAYRRSQGRQCPFQAVAGHSTRGDGQRGGLGVHRKQSSKCQIQKTFSNDGTTTVGRQRRVAFADHLQVNRHGRVGLQDQLLAEIGNQGHPARGSGCTAASFDHKTALHHYHVDSGRDIEPGRQDTGLDEVRPVPSAGLSSVANPQNDSIQEDLDWFHQQQILR